MEAKGITPLPRDEEVPMDSFPDQGANDILGFLSQIAKPKEAWRWSEDAYRHRFRCQVLLERPTSCRELWPQDLVSQRVLRKLFRALDDWQEWPNHNFVPDDPCSVVFFNYWDDLEGAAAMTQVEDALGITIRDKKAAFALTEGTLGGYVEALRGLLPDSSL